MGEDVKWWKRLGWINTWLDRHMESACLQEVLMKAEILKQINETTVWVLLLKIKCFRK